MLLFELNQLHHEVTLIQDVQILLLKKEVFKNQVTNPNINRNQRMIIYKKVQLINNRIKEINRNE